VTSTLMQVLGQLYGRLANTAAYADVPQAEEGLGRLDRRVKHYVVKPLSLLLAAAAMKKGEAALESWALRTHPPRPAAGADAESAPSVSVPPPTVTPSLLWQLHGAAAALGKRVEALSPPPPPAPASAADGSGSAPATGKRAPTAAARKLMGKPETASGGGGGGTASGPVGFGVEEDVDLGAMLRESLKPRGEPGVQPSLARTLPAGSGGGITTGKGGSTRSLGSASGASGHSSGDEDVAGSHSGVSSGKKGKAALTRPPASESAGAAPTAGEVGKVDARALRQLSGYFSGGGGGGGSGRGGGTATGTAGSGSTGSGSGGGAGVV